MARGEFADDTSDMGRSGEIDPAYRRVGDQPLDNRRGILRCVADHIDHAIAQAGVLQYLTDQAMHRRTELGGLEHHGVAARQWHGDRAGGEYHRGVPGRDAQHDAAGLAQGHGETARHIRGDDFTIDLRGHRRRFTQHVGRQPHVEPVPVGHGAGFAGRLDELGTACLQLLGRLEQTAPAFIGGQGGPERKRLLCRGHRGVGIFQGGGGNPRHQLASHRVTAFEGSTVAGGARLAANQQGHVQHGDSSL
ncbi:hypothetical protein D3C81_1227750 [compost metagenome]